MSVPPALNEARAQQIRQQLEALAQSTAPLRTATGEQKNNALETLSSLLSQHSSEILAANKRDLDQLDRSKVSSAFVDRLQLTQKRIQEMQESLRDIIALPNPVNEVTETKTLENGLKIRRVRSPLGIIFMIFEARPNVITEVFALALKSGNVLILRGGSESRATSEVLYRLIHQALQSAKLPPTVFWGITDYDRSLTHFLIQQNKAIDILVPRGGDSLIEYVTEHSRIPIIKNDRGLCHVYVDTDADLAMATAIVVNAKTQRPGVCNSMETLLVHKDVAASLISKVYDQMVPFSVKWFGCPATAQILKGRSNVMLADPTAWDREYLDYCISCKVVQNLDEALRHISLHGSRHSEAIVTQSAEKARLFQNTIDAAAVYWNASTRFTDGFQFGLGGELGISTQKLHVRGPVGLKELTSLRWMIDGTGQIRQ